MAAGVSRLHHLQARCLQHHDKFLGAIVGGELERAVLESVRFFLRVHVCKMHSGWSILRTRMLVGSSIATIAICNVLELINVGALPAVQAGRAAGL